MQTDKDAGIFGVTRFPGGTVLGNIPNERNTTLPNVYSSYTLRRLIV